MAHPIQLILFRQLAGYLSVPLFLVDPKGDLLYYNEPAETVLGRRFDETGRLTAEEWSSIFRPLDEDLKPISPESLPLRKTVVTRRPAHQRIYIQGLDNVFRQIEIASIPILGLQNEFLGAAALFWEIVD
jgi:PAS domain-containing protein